METIKNYLEAMFANMPNTDEVIKAKRELLSMMEDKYNELIEEGKNDNEAVGTVISEFGNLDELAQDLGIDNEVVKEKEATDGARKKISFDEATQFLADKSKSGMRVGIGVLLCIVSVCGPTLCEVLHINDVFGMISMFTMIAIAVGIFVYDGTCTAKWNFIKKELCMIDMETAQYIKQQRTQYESIHGIRLAIGIILCVICWLPAAIIEEIPYVNEDIGGAALFLLVGIGVLIIIYTNTVKESFSVLLNINDKATVSGEYVKETKNEYESDAVADVMSVYWMTITCIYFSWSFLTFDWFITWIIWPMAAIIKGILDACLKKKK